MAEERLRHFGACETAQQRRVQEQIESDAQAQGQLHQEEAVPEQATAVVQRRNELVDAVASLERVKLLR